LLPKEKGNDKRDRSLLKRVAIGMRTTNDCTRFNLINAIKQEKKNSEGKSQGYIRVSAIPGVYANESPAKVLKM
jgi:hypothetical protein